MSRGDSTEDIYDPAFVADLFDRCSGRYRWVSGFASLGFVWIWRRACVRRLVAMTHLSRLKGAERAPMPQVYDLMAGTGEAWPHLLRLVPKARITAIDISAAMHQEALQRLHGKHSAQIQHMAADVLATELPPNSANLLLSTFGLKTLSPAGQERLAQQIAAALAPGAAFALIEASDPKGWALRPLYRFYIDRFLPLIERVILRGAQDFAMIGTYTRNFGDCTHFAEALRRHGLFVAQRKHFFGCATSVAGFKPTEPEVALSSQTL